MLENYQHYIVVKDYNTLWCCYLAVLVPIVLVHHCSSATITYLRGYVTFLSFCPMSRPLMRPTRRVTLYKAVNQPCRRSATL